MQQLLFHSHATMPRRAFWSGREGAVQQAQCCCLAYVFPGAHYGPTGATLLANNLESVTGARVAAWGKKVVCSMVLVDVTYDLWVKWDNAAGFTSMGRILSAIRMY